MYKNVHWHSDFPEKEQCENTILIGWYFLTGIVHRVCLRRIDWSKCSRSNSRIRVHAPSTAKGETTVDSMRRRFTIKPAFMISKIRFCDITKSNLWYHKSTWFFDIIKSILWYHKIDFMISQNRICDITKSNLWYHKIITNLWYHKIDFVISQIWICDITKSNLCYHKIEFVISQNRILWYHKIKFVISQNRDLL